MRAAAHRGFWSALKIATTQSLPLLFYVEDNGYVISVTSDYQTPGRDIAATPCQLRNLAIWNGDGTYPARQPTYRRSHCPCRSRKWAPLTG